MESRVPAHQGCENFGGKSFHYSYEPERYEGKHTIPSKFSIWTDLPSSGIFFICRERPGDRILHALKLCDEIKINQKDLETKILIRSPYLSETRRYIESPEISRAITKLLDAGVTHIEHDGLKLQLSWFPASAIEPLALKKLIAEVLPHIFALRAPLPSLYQKVNSIEGQSYLNFYGLLTSKRWKSSTYILFVSGLLSTFIFWDLYTPLYFLDFLTSAIIFCFSILMLSFFTMHNRIRKLGLNTGQFLSFVFMPLIAISTLLLGGSLFLNARFDNSPEQQVQVVVANKYSVRRKSRRSYYIQVPSWDKDPISFQNSVEFPISQSDYELVQPGIDKALVSYSPGFLGLSWSKGVQILLHRAPANFKNLE